MHLISALVALVLATGVVNASPASNLVERQTVINGKCYGAGDAPGVCIDYNDCSAGGGTSVVGKCPGTPDNIRCCTKTSCGSGGNCRWIDQCTGTTQSGLCPGPTNFKCCFPSGGTCTAKTTLVSGCTTVAINGGNAIARRFPCQVLEIGCKRNCADPTSSDHCVGKATDLMVTAYGVRVASASLSIFAFCPRASH